MDEDKRTVHTFTRSEEVEFVRNDIGETVAHITRFGGGVSISIYHEPQPPPVVTLAMNTRNECLAALTGFLEAWRINNE